MSQSSPVRADWVDVAKQSGAHGREDTQGGWQTWVGQSYAGMKILDVGAGLGLSRARLGANNNKVELQDIAPGLPVDHNRSIDQLPEKNWDIVTCFDVIEHVENDVVFLQQLVRLARIRVIITTPNWNVSRCWNRYHCREYTPQQLLTLVQPYKVAQLIGGHSMHATHTPSSPEDFIKTKEPHLAVVIDVT